MIVKGIPLDKQYDYAPELIASGEADKNYECVYCWKPTPIVKSKQNKYIPRIIKMKPKYLLLVQHTTGNTIDSVSIFNENEGWT